MNLTTLGLVTELTPENILNKVSELELWKMYCPLFKSEKAFCSELRRDKKPTCKIQLYNGRYFYKDFGNGESYNIFGYIQKKYGCNYHEALRIISTDFGLSKVSSKNLSLVVNTSDYIHAPKSSKDIRVKYKKWSKQDLEYWGQYYITLDLLKEYNVFSIDYYWVDQWMFKGEKLCFGYYQNYKWKIYQPLSSSNKWSGNFNSNIYSGYDQLNHLGDTLILTSSLKDVMVWRIFNYNAISPQSEGQKIPYEFIEGLKKRYERIVINFDRDSAGEKAANLLNREYGFQSIFTPVEKDLSDTIKVIGVDKTKQLIKELL